MGWFFTTAALVTFGGAYAVLPYVAQQAVDVFGWLKPGQMIDGLALGETTPGPLIMVVAFVGFVGGWQTGEMGWTGAVLGCLIATYFTFLPSFVFILVGAPFIEQMREELHVTSALTGISAAVVGVILSLVLFFGKTVFVPGWSEFWSANAWSLQQFLGAIDFISLLIAAVAFVALARFKTNLAYVIVIAAAIGWLRLMLGV
jgi:chromate transporter